MQRHLLSSVFCFCSGWEIPQNQVCGYICPATCIFFFCCQKSTLIRALLIISIHYLQSPDTCFLFKLNCCCVTWEKTLPVNCLTSMTQEYILFLHNPGLSFSFCTVHLSQSTFLKREVHHHRQHRTLPTNDRCQCVSSRSQFTGSNVPHCPMHAAVTISY